MSTTAFYCAVFIRKKGQLMQSLFKYRARRFSRGVASKLALLSSRFHALLPTASTISRREHHWEKSKNNRLMVFLPGIDDVAEDFERRGFIADTRHHGFAQGAIAVDAHYGYYASRRIFSAITDDVVGKARSHGYHQIWMVGVSLGGFGAATYAANRPGEIAGLLLLAPYLGGAELISEITAAGGVKHWNPGHVEEGNYPRRLWAWIKHEYAVVGRPRIPLYLGYGKGDRFAAAHRLLAEVIPSSHVFSIPGGHNWKTWTKIWRHFLSHRELVFAK